MKKKKKTTQHRDGEGEEGQPWRPSLINLVESRRDARERKRAKKKNDNVSKGKQQS